jgi:hypothetical protein
MVKVSFLYMFYGFLFGLLVMGLFYKKNKIIIQYPTPTNVNKVVYKDNDERCFKYKAFRTKCSNKNQVIVPSVN